MVQKIQTNLWFETQALEAAEFYISIFKNSKINKVVRQGNEGVVMAVEFEIEGQVFVALNGGSNFKFNPAISFIINCDSQDEIDYYWERLSLGGDEQAQVCGWLKDKYGISWQVVPSNLTKMLNDPNPEKSQNVMKALLQMKKIDINKLVYAYEN
jgi:predicted 3-demethylubiquinone-9 3-methyltransferase (glyoxalase superfamily)